MKQIVVAPNSAQAEARDAVLAAAAAAASP